MILGIDIGNYSLKSSTNLNIKSLICEEENILGSSNVLVIDGKKYVIGEGDFETELNKSSKENFLPLLYVAVALSSNDTINQVVCGLPINQFKANKADVEQLINNNKIKQISLNGKPRKIIISEFKVYPEGVAAYYSLGISDDVIIVDIGGRTTDIAYISNKKLNLSGTVAVGTLNIYKAVANKLNSEYSLDLNLEMIDRIIERGKLKVDNKDVDLSFITEILKVNFMKIKQELDLRFPARTERIILVGGGAKLFGKAFKRRYSNCEIAENNIFANAKGFKKVGENIWQ